ncbi:MAG: hypothetical protein IPM22_02015 [Betaproteobacteria bacterium]|nr:hypothetical protein [Betaproteobacteria bacterium]MCC7218875.1 hypothetical protein [Burkholderiales bacterium]
MAVPWFDPNLYAFIPGTLLGVVGGTMGALAGTLAPRGRARAFVVGAFAAMLALCAVMLVAAVVALAAGQPYGVWYGLGLPGLIGIVVFGALLPVVLARYREAETRRMGAADFG